MSVEHVNPAWNKDYQFRTINKNFKSLEDGSGGGGGDSGSFDKVMVGSGGAVEIPGGDILYEVSFPGASHFHFFNSGDNNPAEVTVNGKTYLVGNDQELRGAFATPDATMGYKAALESRPWLVIFRE